jgi:hypothetical protein
MICRTDMAIEFLSICVAFYYRRRPPTPSRSRPLVGGVKSRPHGHSFHRALLLSSSDSQHPLAPELWSGASRAHPTASPSIRLVRFVGGRFIMVGFSVMCSEPFLNFSFIKKSCKRNFLFASLVKTSAVSLKRLIASARPGRQVIRQTPVVLAPAE